MTGAVGLLLALASIIVYGLGVTVLIWWMFDGRIEPLAGFVGLFGTIGAMAVTILAGPGWVAGAVLVGYISLMVTYPFAETKLAETELRGYNIELMERAYAELHRRPDNIPAAFQLARCLYNYGMRGHAIALSTQTLDHISTNIDPTSNRSLKDFYRAEMAELKKWNEASQDPRFHRPLNCPQCKLPNPPGNLACQRCQAPYLLELARKSDPRHKVMSKLILAWGLIASIIPASAYIGQAIGGGVSIGVVLLALALIGLILWWTFKLAPGETGEVRISA